MVDERRWCYAIGNVYGVEGQVAGGGCLLGWCRGLFIEVKMCFSGVLCVF